MDELIEKQRIELIDKIQSFKDLLPMYPLKRVHYELFNAYQDLMKVTEKYPPTNENCKP